MSLHTTQVYPPKMYSPFSSCTHSCATTYMLTRVGCCKEMLLRRAGSSFSANGGAPLHPGRGKMGGLAAGGLGTNTIQPVGRWRGAEARSGTSRPQI